MPYRRVVLTGFMGAGKTTVGRLLASLLGKRFFDTDALLVARLGESIVELFAQLGEPLFREHEATLIADLLNTESAVIALGGGALEHAATRTLLKADMGTLLVYLQTPLAVSLARCAAEPNAAVRPVLRDQESLELRFTRRKPFYEAADLILPTEGQTPESLAAGIAARVRGREQP